MVAGTLHLVCGMAGSDKTTLARESESRHRAIRLCPDEWIEPMLRDRADRAEMDRIRPVVHELQWQMATRCLSLGTNVVWEHKAPAASACDFRGFLASS